MQVYLDNSATTRQYDQVTDTMIEMMREAGVIPVTLGPRILRAETAAVVSVGMAMTLWGDL